MDSKNATAPVPPMSGPPKAAPGTIESILNSVDHRAGPPPAEALPRVFYVDDAQRQALEKICRAPLVEGTRGPFTQVTLSMERLSPADIDKGTFLALLASAKYWIDAGEALAISSAVPPRLPRTTRLEAGAWPPLCERTAQPINGAAARSPPGSDGGRAAPSEPAFAEKVHQAVRSHLNGYAALNRQAWESLARTLSDAEWAAMWNVNIHRDDVAAACALYRNRPEGAPGAKAAPQLYVVRDRATGDLWGVYDSLEKAAGAAAAARGKCCVDLFDLNVTRTAASAYNTVAM